MSTRPIRFFHRGAIVEAAPASATRTVLEWLREEALCTGTKEGCAEGDCGACTVVVGELGAHGALEMKPVNACIRFLPTLDGKALFTVEDVAGTGCGVRDVGAVGNGHAGVASAAGGLHPAQQAMVECHGSQCGFCTPGFVMSLWACYERHHDAGTRPTRQQLADDLSGNLCRCTGYRPILDAGEKMFEAAPRRLDTAPVLAALQTLAGDAPLSRPDFHAPRTLADLATLCAAKPDARLLAGSTDIGLWVTKQFRELPELIYVGDVAELRAIDERDVDGQPMLCIGAGATLEDAWAALHRRWPLPSLRDMWLRFASLPVRQAGTMGGNVANGSPIGDSAPVLIALDARIVLRQGERVRRMPLADFYVDYMKNRLERGEFVQAIEVPLNQPRTLRTYKISKRFDSDISAVSAGFGIELDGDSTVGTVKSVRLAFGGMAAIVKRAAAAEAALLGQPWSEATLAAGIAALAQDFKPLTDMRASAAYRAQVAGNLLRRFWLETRRESPLAESDVSVFARDASIG
ncbi:MAG: xanthine dehydrogenase small subunit [Burkholderiales bacterium]|nr:xanthine dehydrogenase small subunit [Burkholderiales bacterium]